MLIALRLIHLNVVSKGPKMRRLTVLATLVALSGLALVGPALAQDDGGGASSSGAATIPDSPTSETGPASPDSTAANEATPGLPACAPGSTTVTSAPCTAPVLPTAAPLTSPDPKPTEDPYGMHPSGPPSPATMEILNTGNGQTRV